MRIKSLVAGLLLSSLTANASITISGTSIVSSVLNGYSTGVFVASNSSSFDVSVFTSDVIPFGISLTQGTDLFGYTVLGSASINTAGSNSVLGSGVTYNLGGSVATGNEIGVLVFNSSTSFTKGGDPILIFAGSPAWTVPADGSNLPLLGSPNFGLTPVATSQVLLPEPSAYSTLAGFVALGFVMLRRHR